MLFQPGTSLVSYSGQLQGPISEEGNACAHADVTWCHHGGPALLFVVIAQLTSFPNGTESIHLLGIRALTYLGAEHKVAKGCC